MPGRIKVAIQRQYVCVWIVYCVFVSAYVCIEHPPVPKHLSVRAGLPLLHPDCCFEWFLLILSVSPAHPAHHPDASQQCRESCHLHPARVWGVSRLSKIALDYINNAQVVITLRQTIEYSLFYVLHQREKKSQLSVPCLLLIADFIFTVWCFISRAP